MTKRFALWRTGLNCCGAPLKESETERNQGSAEGGMAWPSLAGGLAPPTAPGSPCVSLEAEVPEALFEGMREFIRNHPQWDQYSVITSALAGFLFQNGARDTCVKDHYLSGLFSEI